MCTFITYMAVIVWYQDLDVCFLNKKKKREKFGTFVRSSRRRNKILMTLCQRHCYPLLLSCHRLSYTRVRLVLMDALGRTDKHFFSDLCSLSCPSCGLCFKRELYLQEACVWIELSEDCSMICHM